MVTKPNFSTKSAIVQLSFRAIGASLDYWIIFAVMLLGFSIPVQASESTKVAATPYIKLESMTVNLQDSQYLQLKINLQVADPRMTETIVYFTPIIRHELIMLLSNHKAEDFATTQDKQKLRATIKAIINKDLNLDQNEGVTDVLLEAFLIQ